MVPLKAVIAISVLSLLLGLVSLHFLWPLIIFLPLAAVGLWDLRQPEHSLLRNYPIWGHLRYLIEAFGPEIRQYIVEHNREGMPHQPKQL